MRERVCVCVVDGGAIRVFASRALVSIDGSVSDLLQ